ncbi:sulfotransferase domain-containing protein [Roseimicrobium gellanilyticum]|uniref:Sulfotransferase domain-containing protein n=1 Tax=Roseimicrobium gellanilyticum TaxID=748857 RepID=A0A366HCM7_9BACT|nr:sulfotransferase domain-containing protein [Roseimicrobium gellanilyticum]RBP39730.1 sulfotransferase domain-containing protein [Roseimicrobium gellanilyticum]
MPSASRNPAAVFHLTHAKAGSQWVYQVLDALFPHRIVHPQAMTGQYLDGSLREDGIYPTVYATREEFEAGQVPAHHRKFFVIRDLRDTLVSLYFSLKHSHPSRSYDIVSLVRTDMGGMTDEQGMEFLLSTYLERIAQTQLSWLDGDAPIYRYEDGLRDPIGFFGRMLDHSELRVSNAMLRNVIDSMSFEKRSGRLRGEEDRNSHYRLGVSGDWQNHLQGTLLEKFLARYGHVLVKTGYEKAEALPSTCHVQGGKELQGRTEHVMPELPEETVAILRAYRCKDHDWFQRQWQQAGPARPENSLQQDTLITGTGWYPVEEQEGRPFCWVADEAELTVRRPSGGMTRLHLEVEPGPSIGSLPAKLSVLDQNGQSITAEEMVPARQWITLDLSACVGDTGEDWNLVLKVEGAGAAVTGDARTMSYRVFRFGWAPTLGARQDAWGMEGPV